LVAFSGAMFGPRVQRQQLLLYVFWELTTVLSFLLVGHYAERATSRRAARGAVVTTLRAGQLVRHRRARHMSGTYLLSDWIASPPTVSRHRSPWC